MIEVIGRAEKGGWCTLGISALRRLQQRDREFKQPVLPIDNFVSKAQCCGLNVMCPPLACVSEHLVSSWGAVGSDCEASLEKVDPWVPGALGTHCIETTVLTPQEKRLIHGTES